MNPISPWLDPHEVRSLAEQLMWQPREPVPATDPGFTSGFVGYATEDPTPPTLNIASPLNNTPLQSNTPLGNVSLPLRNSAPLQSFAAPTNWKPSEPARMPANAETIADSGRVHFLENFAKLRDWIHHHHAVTGIFIIDHEGSVIFEDSPHTYLHSLAKSMVLAPRQQGDSPENVRVKIGAGVTLEIIPVNTSSGRFVLGAVVPNALPADAIDAVVKEIKHAAAHSGLQ